MSKVVKFRDIGGPEQLHIIEEDVGDPGPGEVRIKIKAIGINRAESLYRSGKYFEQPILPSKLGYEAAGIVEAIGADVDEFKIGDVVSVIPNFSFHDYGFYGDTALARATSLVKHPENLSFEEAASVWMAYLTAYDALIGTAKLSKGEIVLIPAASSSVGLASIQLANLIGAVPVALTRTSEKKNLLLSAGAAHVIATDEQDIAAEVRRISHGAGFQVLFDPVGGPAFATLLEVAAPRARILLYGTIGEPTVIPHFPVFTKMLTITGALLFTTTSDPDKLKVGVDWVLRGLESGALKPVIAKTFPLDQISDAHRYMESNKQFGKIVVTV